jgi:site-specific DNA-methyltransferase (adenine-specific)
MWIYSSGFPKSHNIGKKVEGYEGWGTALKPAHEPIVMARKPLSEKSVAENVIKWGTGGINIDESRVKTTDNFGGGEKASKIFDGDGGYNGEGWVPGNEGGRFPANIIFDEEAGKILDEQTGITQYNKDRKPGNYKGGHRKEYVGTIDNDIEKKVEGNFYSDSGGASRFFYCPKASKKEKDAGLDNMELKKTQLNSGGIGRKTSVEKRLDLDGTNTPMGKNTHPTIKPLALMEYLIKLITRPGGVVLDCFMGSGSTGLSAKRNGYSFIGIEKEQEYFDIAQQRINHQLL